MDGSSVKIRFAGSQSCRHRHATAFWSQFLAVVAIALCVATSSFAQPAESPGPAPAAAGRAALSPGEAAWLAQHDGTIRIGITVIPPQVIRRITGYEGLAIDYIRLMERKIGCRFVLVPFATWSEVIQAAKERRIDMIFAAQQTPERLSYLLFSEPYIELPNMIVVRKDHKGGRGLAEMKGWSVAASAGSAVYEYLKGQYPQLNLRPVDDELGGLMKVSLGEVDAMVVEISRASYYIEKAGILNLRVAGDAGLTYRLRFAVRNDWPVLRGILDKGLLSVTPEEKRNINRRWILVGEKSLFASRSFRTALAVGVVGIVLAIAGVVVWNRALQRTVRERTLELQQELAERRRAEEALERDITERKRAEEDIRRISEALEQRVEERTVELGKKNEELRQEMESRSHQQQFLEALLESTEAGIVACDANGILTLFNRKTRELHGLPQEPIPADRWAEYYDLFLPDGKTPMRREDVPLFRALQGERVANVEMMIIPRGGEAKILLASGQPILDKDGRKIGAVVAMHDITERMRIEETLRASEERYRSVVENIGIGVTMIGPGMEVLAQNACMRKWFPRVDVSLRPICYENYIDPPRDGLCIGCPTYLTLQDGQVHDAIIETPAGDRTLYFRVLSSPIRDRNGTVVAATEMVEDVTEQQTVENELRRYREHLEELIEERTADLAKANRRLVSELTERKLAEEKARMLNEQLEQRVQERTAELEEKNRDLERMNKMFVGREIRMVELKERIRKLEKTEE